MINLTDKQSEILEEFLKFSNENDEESGLTSGSLGKRGINRKTFTDNLEFLLNHDLLKQVKIIEHGHQKWKFYEITSFGIIALYLWQHENKEIKKIEFNEKFFPLIKRHEKVLRKLTKDQFNRAFVHAISSITFEPVIEVYDEISKKYVTHTKEHVASIYLKLSMDSFIILRKNYTLGDDVMMDIVDKEGKVIEQVNWTGKNKDKSDELLEKFVFLFYLHLLYGGQYFESIHPRKMFKNINNLKEKHGSIKDKSNPPSMMNLVDLKELLDGYDANEINKVWKNNIAEIFQIIKKDKEFSKLMIDNFSEIFNAGGYFADFKQIIKEFKQK